mmetsp:Transcript_12286/g.33775  ORF Transcript_12286/g.33775 Transcript_12286/m.33775 type:complete len:86 (-) Transcript_12286:454-711(-)
MPLSTPETWSMSMPQAHALQGISHTRLVSDTWYSNRTSTVHTKPPFHPIDVDRDALDASSGPKLIPGRPIAPYIDLHRMLDRRFV